MNYNQIFSLFLLVSIWCFWVFICLDHNILFKHSCSLLFCKCKVLISCWTDVYILFLLWVCYWESLSHIRKNYRVIRTQLLQSDWDPVSQGQTWYEDIVIRSHNQERATRIWPKAVCPKAMTDHTKIYTLLRKTQI